MRKILCLLMLVVLNVVPVFGFYEFGIDNPSHDLSVYSTDLGTVSFDEGHIIVDSNDLSLYKAIRDYDAYTWSRVSFEEDGSEYDSGNFYGDYNLSENGDISAVIYIVALDGSVTINYSDDDGDYEIDADDLTIEVPSVMGSLKIGSEVENCQYSLLVSGNIESLSFKSCEVFIDITADDGNSYSYISNFDDASIDINITDYNSSQDYRTTAYVQGDLYNMSSDELVGYLRIYMNSQFLITDLDGNVL